MKPIGYIQRTTLETLKDGISVNAIISATEFAGMVPVFSEAEIGMLREEQDLKDAARYRWLRVSDFDIFGSPHAVDLSGASLDEAIDAAMLKTANAKLTGACAPELKNE